MEVVGDFMQTTLSSDWLDIAANKGATKWLQKFIRFYLAQLQKGALTSEGFADELNQEFASRRLESDAQQKNYRSNVVQALKVLDPEHPAIALVALSTEQYRVLNDEQKERVADRETRFIDDPVAIVDLAQQLLESAEWSEVGAGLAVLIGRRISEIVLSDFSLQSPWSLSFSLMAKKAEDQDITIEVPTLAPAEAVLEAIEKLQSSLSTPEMRHNAASFQMAKRQVNRLYSHAIAEQCEQHFSGLVPTRSDKDNLYTHIFRAVYATIAAHWFCPPNVPEHLFKAEIQGHFTLNQEGKKLPNYAARSNYDDYAIGDGQGNRDGRLGVKLAQVDGLQVIEAFRSASKKEENENEDADEEDIAIAGRDDLTLEDLAGGDAVEPEQPGDAIAPTDIIEKKIAPTETTEVKQPEGRGEMAHEEKEKQTKRPNLYVEDLERLVALMAQEGVAGSTAELLQALLDAYETQKGQQQQAHVQTIGEVAQTFNWFTKEIEALRGRIMDLEDEREQLQGNSSDAEQLHALQAENQQLRRQLNETQTQLEGIHKVLGGGHHSMALAQPTPTIATSTSTPSNGTDTRQRDRSGAKAKVEGIINDIIHWNTAQNDNDTRLRISIPVIKSLGALVGATYQPVIQEVLKEQQPAIDDIHQRFLIGSRHNARRDIDKNQILQAIAKDYMRLPNWKDVKYA